MSVLRVTAFSRAISCFAEHGRGRVVRRVDDDHARLRRNRGGNLVPVHAKIRQRQFDWNGRGALQTHDRAVAIERRLKVDHFVARMHERADRRVQTFARTRDHGDFARRVIAHAVQRLNLVGERFAQCGNAGHRRVLVMASAHGLRDALDQLRIRREVRRALRQIQRVVLCGQLADHGKNRRANVRQFRAGLHGALHKAFSLSPSGGGFANDVVRSGSIRFDD